MIIFSDLHLSTKTRDVALEVLRRIPQECRRLGENHVAFLGDFFEVRHVIQLALLIEARDIMSTWDEFGIDLVDILPGNHDMFNIEGRNALEVFDGIPGCRVHTHPTWTADGLWIPFRHTQQEIQEALELERPGDEPPICFAHASVKGAMMNNHLANSDGIPDDMFKRAGFKRVFLGHYHKHQTVRKGMSYIGSPYQVTYGEAGQPKGFMTWDGKRAEFHEWSVGPKHHKLVIDADHPAEIQLPNVEDGDKLWVQVKGHMAGTMRDVVSAQLKKSGLDVDRLEVDLQPTAYAGCLERQAGEDLDQLAHRFVDAQDADPAFKDMLHEAWRRLS